MNVASGTLGTPPSSEQLDVRPDRGESIDLAPAALIHAVRTIERTLAVNQQWPRQLGIARVRLGHVAHFERDYTDRDAQPFPLISVLSQLRQMLATRQSPEMAMEIQEQPFAAEIFKLMGRAVGAVQCELRCGFAYQVTHRIIDSTRFIGPCDTW